MKLTYSTFSSLHLLGYKLVVVEKAYFKYFRIMRQDVTVKCQKCQTDARHKA